MSTDQSTADFGQHLRHWRGLRRLSQLDLAMEAEISSRHLSFLETGRAQPSRSMVLTLADALDMPLEARNGFLNAAGFTGQYSARPLAAPELKLPAQALSWMLDRHDPYPGFALDRHWRLAQANATATKMLAAAGLTISDSLLEACGPKGALRPMILNWPQVARYLASRLRSEISHYGEDPVLEAHLRALLSELPEQSAGPIPPVLPVEYLLGDQRFSFISTIAHFGGANDIALVDLRIELLFPADEATAAALSGG